MPVGSGQLAGTGSTEMKAAAAAVPAAQARMRLRAIETRRPVSSDQPQATSGIRKIAEVSPTNCMTRSETTAPGVPRALRTGSSVAWLQLGSSTDQVASAAASAATSAIRPRPLAPAKLRRSAWRRRLSAGIRAEESVLDMRMVSGSGPGCPSAGKAIGGRRPWGQGAAGGRTFGGRLRIGHRRLVVLGVLVLFLLLVAEAAGAGRRPGA
ncbi:hypothetical protein A6302_03986 [Methylobrevis pamukkalensis]|uniref:Uncharacterized protein n=1 Tax=Methylobrevis pamukkalensis TaxID=1439726 RepID=A0A1E3GXB5_9HYPH|nr:hypothetical protein A6302_03986 [Methylobrevis pamukkalensis]